MSDPTGTYDFDFAIAGGGPAGASAAIALARKGHRVALFEKERFPRFHIGESLLPTSNEAFAELGVAEQVAAANFPKKWGARLLTFNGEGGRGVDFASSREIAQPQTYQVCREEFDRILLDRAREVGVEVREGHRVAACAFDSAGVSVEVAEEGPDAAPARSVRVRAIVDATGRQGLLARMFALRSDEPKLANVAVYSHFAGVPRLEGDRPNDIRIIARADAGWFWLIPINDELTSVGVVVPRSLYMNLPHGSPEEMLARAVADAPVVAELMRDARREWPVRVEKDFSYGASAYAGERWLLAGDAGSFLDPVFSTGVSIAMESGIEAAQELDRALARNDFSARAFARFSRRQERRFEIFRRFVLAFYTPEFRDLFFQPDPPRLIFRAVVTILAGNWRPSLWTRFLVEVFFGFVELQRRFRISPSLFRRDAAAGYPTREPA
jgi:flavin-dependent dehydrogenase